MSRLPQRFIEDRALRDAARAVLEADIAHLRASLEEQGVGSRVTSSITGRVSEGARDVFEQAKAAAGDHRGALAALVGAILLWLARAPILEWLGLGDDGEPSEEEAGSPSHGSVAAADRTDIPPPDARP